MIDISIKAPPAPTPPRHGGVDPVASIPRSHRIDRSKGSQEKDILDQAKKWGDHKDDHSGENDNNNKSIESVKQSKDDGGENEGPAEEQFQVDTNNHIDGYA
ncbi:MAG: hypothetical protein HOM84_02690 [Thiotrichales bacterium]|jgi:hypothetical protein|nr:hypothetical protein [Thiotrichales bacterium]MBT4262361.1 hypothetical protein [Thiotrichales bacterium]MBT4971442.1 hypothetical protein [Thiotrichales bacterium]MBT5291307.1 hypothetical protein [Thiotrichales bacterium]MBT5418960.1 hypothetical protein [Thiotrichales bacterium]